MIKANTVQRSKKYLGIATAIIATICIAKASYIQLKAELAQALIAQAYHQQHDYQTPLKPWPWADMHVVAKITINQQSAYVLSDASARNLAFGPAHMSQSVLPGQIGNSVIVGHRDTHFAHLQEVAIGQNIELELRGLKIAFRVTEIAVVEEDQVAVLEDLPTTALTLITCYPFTGIDPDPNKRFIVRAVKIS